MKAFEISVSMRCVNTDVGIGPKILVRNEKAKKVMKKG
jgi:hypothetical protein